LKEVSKIVFEPFVLASLRRKTLARLWRLLTQIIILPQIHSKPITPYPITTPFTPSKKTEETRMNTETQEIRREKVYIPQNMTTKEIMKKYNISESSASTTRKRGWFVKN